MADTYNGYEMPPFVVEARYGPVELRAYAPMILAEVTVEGSRRGALSQGFRVLARYIFGGNTAQSQVAMTVPVTQTTSQDIAMTVPVTQTGSDNNRWTVSFMMPATWTMDTLPTPENPAITLRQTEPTRAAVLAFSGRASGPRLAEYERRLRAAVDAAGLTATGPIQHAYYDDPFTLPWARRNEVALPVE